MEFKTWDDYSAFARCVTRSSRYVRSADNRTFLDLVLEGCKNRLVETPEKTNFWRAQIGNDWRPEVVREEDGTEIERFEIACPFEPERMKPKADRAFEGRINPKGIPCLYLCTDRDTSMAETRPWIGSQITVASFVTTRPLRLVDCGGPSQWLMFSPSEMDSLAAADKEKCVWGAINDAFSSPVGRNDDLAEYAPTQVLAEEFRHAGFDGVQYRSMVGTGKNVALFRLEDADPVECYLCRVEEMIFKFYKGIDFF